MYIRRKAYSVAYDENGDERLFSTTEIMNEESYLEKLYSEKSEKDKKKSKIASGVATGLGAGAIVAGVKSKNALEKAKEIANSYNRNALLNKYDKRIAAKTGTTVLPFGGVMGDSEKVKKAEELSKRHKRVVQNAVNKLANKSLKLGATGLALGTAGLGAAAYGLKKKGDAKKDE